MCVRAAHYETMQDKLAQLKDARDALNVLREEHREKRRREQEELERLRQIQMAQKLEVLRQKKQVRNTVLRSARWCSGLGVGHTIEDHGFTPIRCTVECYFGKMFTHIYAWSMVGMWPLMGKVSAVGQPTRPTQPSIPSGW